MTGIPPGDDLHRRRARDLAEVAAARVLEGRAHEAMLLAWGADLEILQECVRQALVDRAGQSPAEYYGALERAFAVSDGAVVAEPVPTAAIALAQARAIALERLRPFTGEIHPQWEQVPGLDAVAESTPGSAEQFAAVRLEGHSLTEFARLRIGIGEVPAGRNAAGYVLGKFPLEEQAPIQQAIQTAADAVADWIQHGIDFSMNHYNGN